MLHQLEKIKVIASVSGGKDSTAMSLFLTENGIEHIRVFANTGWEHPATVEYIIETLQPRLGPIDVVSNDLGFDGLDRSVSTTSMGG